ncbi:MAG: replication-relaxation family protein [Heyndrickxia sp.]
MEGRKYNFGINKKRSLHLNERDLAMLKLISVYGVLSKKELNYYSCNLYGDNEVAIKKRLERWCTAKVIVRKVYGPRKQVSYHLGPKGREILEETELITKGKPLSNNVIPRNIDHFFGLRDLMVKIHVEVERLELSVQSYSPYELDFKKDYELGVFIRPDWILKINKWQFNIEFDTGSESIAIILDKAARYAEWAIDKPNEYHHILFTVIDNVDSTFTYMFSDYGINRKKRVLNLKTAIIRTGAHRYPNLKFSVAQISRMPQVLKQIANVELKTENHFLESDVSSFQLLLDHNSAFEYVVEKAINPFDIYLYDVDNTLFGDAHFLLKSETDSKTKVMIVKFLKEGDVATLDNLEYLNLLKRQQRLKVKVDYIIGVYNTNEELKADSIGNQDNVILTSMEKLYDLTKSPFYS